MAVFTTQHLAGVAVGVGAGASTLAFVPGADWTVVSVTALSGYVGSLLPDIDDETALAARIVRHLSKLAAVIVPAIQFSLRPTDLLIAIPVALFMTAHLWQLLHDLLRKDGPTHSVIAAICLSFAVAWIAYLSAGTAAAVPSFLAAGTGYLLHLLLEDLGKAHQQPPETITPSLTLLGRGQSIPLYSILAIGFFCAFALWGI